MTLKLILIEIMKAYLRMFSLFCVEDLPTKMSSQIISAVKLLR